MRLQAFTVSALLACSALTAPALGGQDPAVQQPRRQVPETPDDQQVIRVDVDVVTIRFSVHDAEGRFINDLAQEDFRVREAGRPQEIVFFEPPRSPGRAGGRLWLALLIDVSGSTFSTRAEEILATRTFFDSLERFTQVGVFGFTDQIIPFQDFTPDRSLALRAFNQAHRHLGKTAVYGSVDALVSRMKSLGSPGDRRVIVLASDGLDDAYAQSAHSIALARQNKVSIYTIQVPSAAQLHIRPRGEIGEDGAPVPPSPAQKEEELKQKAFARLSQQTGGLHFSGFGAILDFERTLANITDDVFGNLYSVGYRTDYPRLTRDQRGIQVSVQKRGLLVSSLFTSLPEQLNVKKRVISALFGEDDTDGFDLGLDYREIGADLDILRSRSDIETGLPFRLKINPLTLSSQSGGVRTQLGIVGQLLDNRGQEVVRLREIFRVDLSMREIANGSGVIYTNKLLAPAGTYNLRLAILEIASWKMTSFERVVQIGR